jgi:hypothetical protein
LEGVLDGGSEEVTLGITEGFRVGVIEGK